MDFKRTYHWFCYHTTQEDEFFNTILTDVTWLKKKNIHLNILKLLLLLQVVFRVVSSFIHIFCLHTRKDAAGSFDGTVSSI